MPKRPFEEKASKTQNKAGRPEKKKIRTRESVMGDAVHADRIRRTGTLGEQMSLLTK